MPTHEYSDVIVEVRGQIGVIKLNRPKSLNTFGGNLITDLIVAVKELDDHPDTVFTVITGEGRFFCAGADLRGSGTPPLAHLPPTIRKLQYLALFSPWIELVRSLIDHKKVYVLALNGPAVGGGAAFFCGVADLILAAKSAYLMVPFSALGLVPEMGSAVTFAHKLGVARANEFLMFGRRWPVEELQAAGMVNRIFETDGFHAEVLRFLEEQLDVNEGQAMIEVKKAQNRRLRDERMIAVVDAVNALAERFVEGAPFRRIQQKVSELEAQSKSRSSKI